LVAPDPIIQSQGEVSSGQDFCTFQALECFIPLSPSSSPSLSMRLLILSDLHREIWCQSRAWAVGDEALNPFNSIDLSISQPDVVVLAGDIDVGTRGVRWADEKFPVLPVIYVHGNHEGYGHNIDTLAKEITSASASTGHIQHLNRGEQIIGHVRFL